MTFNSSSSLVTVFHDRTTPEPGYVAGYAALIQYYKLPVPLPDRLAIISQKHKQYETADWRVFTPRHAPDDSVMGHITFALKYEGIDLLLLKKLFTSIPAEQWCTWLALEPTGQYSRRTWFLYEWVLETRLPLPDLASGNYIDVLDEELQYGVTGQPSKRHRVRNNLPGVVQFCPLVRRTKMLDNFIAQQLGNSITNIMGRIHPDVMARTAAFLLLKDSKASYAIEGERPPQNRAQRWGSAIGQAGQKAISEDELLRLQQIVIDSPRFTKMGWRTEGGFVGEHDREHGTPLPEHISARSNDIPTLMQGLINTEKRLEAAGEFDGIIAAAIVAFGFVFIHPFVDGNGRIHRYLLHHVLTRTGYVPPGFIFPVSAIMLQRLNEYRQVLEAHSTPRLTHIKWRTTAENNVEVLNDTIDLYRYYDATKQAEFLYSCVQETVEHTIPEEVVYLQRFDRMKSFLDNYIEMPDKIVALLVRFLEQGKGKLSERARQKEFATLTDEEVKVIEGKFAEVFFDK